MLALMLTLTGTGMGTGTLLLSGSLRNVCWDVAGVAGVGRLKIAGPAYAVAGGYMRAWKE